LPCCVVRWPTALAPSCGRSSGFALSSSGCMECSSARYMCGVCSGQWASARKSPSAAPLSVTSRQYSAGSARPGPRSKKVCRRATTDRLHRRIGPVGAADSRQHLGPQGCTPVVQFHFNWKHVSAIAGLTRTSFAFRLYDGAVKSAQIVEFLKGPAQAAQTQAVDHLGRCCPAQEPHRTRLPGQHQGAIQMALLPGYAPDLNPVEYLVGLAQTALFSHA